MAQRGFPDWFDHFPQTFAVSFRQTNANSVKYGLSVIVVIWLAVGPGRRHPC